MGSTDSNLHQQAILPETHSILTHRHLGKITISPSEPQSFVKTYHFVEEMSAMQKMRRINARNKKFADSPYILQIGNVQVVKKQEMCANNYDLVMHFQKYDQNLKKLLENRIKQRKILSEKEIYQFLNKVIQSLIFLQDNGFKNCHIDKQSIVFCQQNVKILDLGISKNSLFQTFMQNQQQISQFYVAPQLLKDLKQLNYEPYLSPKSDVFSLGMIALELACMQPLDNYYNFQKFTIDYESLIHRVSRIVYSVELKTLIAGMLQYEPDMRLGLISSQQKVRKALNLGQDCQGDGTNRRSRRSSSTKMLKDLLTNSRRNNMISSDNSSLNRKQSQSSLASITMKNQRVSVDKQQKKLQKKQRKFSDVVPSFDDTFNLKNLVRNKTEQTKQATLPNQKIDQQNKENVNKNMNESAFEKSEVKKQLLQMNRKNSFNSRTLFDTSTCISKQCKKMQSTTPKMNQYLQRINGGLKKQQSIFRMIEQDSQLNSIKTTKQCKKIDKNVPDFSPVLPPIVPRVQQTSSIQKQDSDGQQIQTDIAQFAAETKQSFDKNQLKQRSPQILMKHKTQLDKIYKTAQSITSSDQKSTKKQSKLQNIYKKLQLPNKFTYEGEIKQPNTMQGNGVLYNEKDQIIYSGSWQNNLYDGFGTSHNLDISHVAVNMYDFGENPKAWVKYQGEFSKGAREGFGTIYFSHGERFSGCMRNGKVNGYGCFYHVSNQMTSGIWVNNKLQN